MITTTGDGDDMPSHAANSDNNRTRFFFNIFIFIISIFNSISININTIHQYSAALFIQFLLLLLVVCFVRYGVI